MKKLMLVAICAIIGSGCANEVRNWEINKSLLLCKDHDGISSIYTSPNYSVRCNDGFFTSYAGNNTI